MSPDNHVATNWRLNPERLKLVGCICEKCTEKIFPPRPICPKCNYEITAQFFEIGTVKAILDHKENSERDVELAINKENQTCTIKIGLNGLSHSIGLEVGMKLPVFVRKSLNGGEPFYTTKIISSSSK